MKETERIAGGLQQLNHTAVQAAGSGDYKQALALFRQALHFEDTLGFKTHAAESLANIATTCLLLRDYSSAMEAADTAECMFREQWRNEDLRTIAVLKGTIMLHSGCYEMAARQFDVCLSQARTPQERGAIYSQAAHALCNLQQQHRAQEYWGRAVAEYERINDIQGTISCLRQRAMLFKTSGRKDLAVKDLQRCALLAGIRKDSMKAYEEL
ncbi:hypothetical protein [Pelotalea chapellei]|uniref:Tetratricopeptide repeat protein n=1 Tax=Pelotalea chapellei TaxID=44671 RepID=A0ABS5U7N5_9BACT|nr:hypothetical protein [Pelotalea chapellei]MBT1071668.1 hypothetical protein [Pelotalea chapellei]